jgi:hypothetical protein
MTAIALIKFAPVVTLKRVNHETWQDPNRTLYWSGSLELATREIPLLIDHDWERQVGTVDALFEMPYGDGPWYTAHAAITEPPAWLTQRDTKASFARLNRDSLWVGRCERVRHAHVTEVSILSPDTRPCEPLAEVTSLRRRQPEPTREPEGEIIWGGPMVRRDFKTTFTVR